MSKIHFYPKKSTFYTNQKFEKRLIFIRNSDFSRIFLSVYIQLRIYCKIVTDYGISTVMFLSYAFTFTANTIVKLRWLILIMTPPILWLILIFTVINHYNHTINLRLNRFNRKARVWHEAESLLFMSFHEKKIEKTSKLGFVITFGVVFSHLIPDRSP